MRSWTISIFLALATVAARGEAELWWKWFSPELRQLERERGAIAGKLRELGDPVVGHTAVEFGYQHTRWPSRLPNPVWVQVDLKSTQPIGAIVLFPAQLDWQSVNRPAFAFPLRFRVDISNDQSFKPESITPVGVFTEEDFPNPGVAPVTIHCRGHSARYVRLTVTKLPEVNGQFFYALSEIAVLSGNLNLAVNCPVRATANFDLPPRWAIGNLVDGRTALGPPIRRQLLDQDGLYAGPDPEQIPPWMQVDLGAIYPVQQLRLHPIHARLGADVPGFSFPSALRVEISRTEDFFEPTVLLLSSNFSNPGNNPVTLWATNAEAQFVRITALTTNSQGEWRFGLSELEVYSGGRNVARTNATVSYVRPVANRTANWPLSLLVDGFTSYGELMELPEWLQSWETRQKLQTELQRLEQLEITYKTLAQRRAAWTGAGTGVVAAAGIGGFMLAGRRRRLRELENFRLRLTRDIHDEIGSNLAGIAMLSEVALETAPTHQEQRKDWSEVNSIARETLGAMREVLWLADNRGETSLDLMKHLQLAASRMLVGKEVHWKSIPEQLPADWPAESRRQIFLIFKEALTNIVRHAQARRVELSAQIEQNRFHLTIADDGCGFDPAEVHPGIGSTSLQVRARALRGVVRIRTAPGQGTVVFVDVPLTAQNKFWPFGRVSQHSLTG